MTAAGNAFADLRAREFAWRGPGVYLNAASYGPLPARSVQAINAFNERRWETQLTDTDLNATLANARNSAARLINAGATEIALTPNTNVAINIAVNAAYALGDDRKVIVVSDREFPANFYSWLALEKLGFKVEVIPSDERGMPREDAMIERISRGDVAAATISFVQFASGFRADLNAIGSACRAQRTLFAVDAIQGLGAVPLDVQQSHIDLLACGGQKWLCSPWASGFAYIRQDLIQRFEPLLPGWLAFTASQDYTRLTDYKYEYLDDARRFEAGSLGFQDFLGLNEALELMLGLGIDAIWQHIQGLQQPIIDWARDNGVEIVSDMTETRRSGILCVRPPDPERAHEQLIAANVRCALRENSIRLSPHWYNTPADIERVLDVLKTNLAR